ncbi:TolC family protein [Sphingobacterium bambusae]|uniref:TolC family protein n=1 Tax=Sphingobacterium bambusae TaxID=662858 RepID=A0ABW6BR08_9SPHI|nr:TolC family protein [Sphingobacterium bambusae]WPL48035.1 TolC family protein [Sphingobacterium bambusae]
MRYIYTIVLTLCTFLVCQSQTYDLQQLEASFLQNNYALLAQKFEIGRAEAEIVQEKLWPNPTLAISEVNLWANGTTETLPRLFGSYGRGQQVSVELEQLIETAGKRSKRVAIKQIEHRSSVYAFEELVRELKKELRQTYYQLSSLSQERKQLAAIVDLFTQLNEQYGRQAALQNVSKVDYYRVQSELITQRKELANLDDDVAAYLETLRVLTKIDGISLAQLALVSDDNTALKAVPTDMLAMALDQNIGLKRQNLQVEQAGKQWQLEKAQRKPDLTLQLGYDRGGNIMQDFIGLGLSLDLPVFNRNKGNIKAAKFQLDKEEASQQALKWALENAVVRLEGQLQRYQQALSAWPVEAAQEQEDILNRYKKHLQSGQVTLIEFIDFTQASRDAHKAYLDTWENYNITYEELQYLVGKDF